MKHLYLYLFLFLLSSPLSAQRFYKSSGIEFILGQADVSNGSQDFETIPRFTFLNLQYLINYDVSPLVGFFSGVDIRNVGFILDEGNDNNSKFRTYNVGVPFAIKLGPNLSQIDRGFFLFAGAEAEFPMHYKEEIFDGNTMITNSRWLSSRSARFMPSVFAGVQFLKGMNIKIRYYPNNFFNQDFTTETSNGTVQPYADLNANLFHVAIGWGLFERKKDN